MTAAGLALKYGLSKRTVQSRMKEIEAESGRGKRYARQSMINDGNIVFVNELVFLDWLSVRQRFRDTNAKKYLDPFDPGVWVKYLGWNDIPTAME